jgi:transcription-repair coupling factor (superfamily II helicase)
VVPKIQMMQKAHERLSEIFPNLNVMQAHGQMKVGHGRYSPPYHRHVF